MKIGPRTMGTAQLCCAKMGSQAPSAEPMWRKAVCELLNHCFPCGNCLNSCSTWVLPSLHLRWLPPCPTMCMHVCGCMHTCNPRPRKTQKVGIPGLSGQPAYQWAPGQARESLCQKIKRETLQWYPSCLLASTHAHICALTQTAHTCIYMHAHTYNHKNSLSHYIA